MKIYRNVIVNGRENKIMKVYVTSIFKEEVEYEGPEISASSWTDAEKQAEKQGAIVIGELA